MEEDNKFETKDISLIAYLDLKGYVYKMTKRGQEAICIFTKSEVEKAVQSFYDDLDSFLAYANKLRNLKSRIRNTY